ncbi:YIP1 family protein [Anaerocolumna sp. AGMB13020]|uniref:YIP1 family protein n=1 Tax=Anaerocolumna sp. AGMB13020 TaxID=3081750 RepID=UPI00295432EA|nr:YIP1 family protein [Anaerocolumna sp. AGMB13020]WOO37246.1 YIP1 family protein [Anaerocolumna sp. AGMB13020]
MGKYFSKDKWNYMFYTISHPMDGYYWIRHENRGSVPLAILMVILFSACFSANRLLASFVVSDVDPRSVDSYFEFLGVLAFYALICVSNWSVTCLMNGEGRMKDIAIAVGYSTVPMSTVLAAGTLISWFIADDEQPFYVLLLGAGIVFGILLMLIGIMQVHNYTLGKTLGTLFITFLAMLVIIFLLLLLSNLLGMVVTFIRSIYTEIIFRT